MNGIDIEEIIEALKHANVKDAITLEDLINRHEWEDFGRVVRNVVDAYRECKGEEK